MPRKKTDSGVPITDPEELRAARQIDFFSSNGATDSIADWDIKPEALAELILGALAHNHAIMFGVSRNGGAVSIAVKSGDAPWQRKYCDDGFDFVELVDQMVSRLPKKAHLKLMEAD